MAREEWLECMGRINRRASSTPRKTDGGVGPRSEMLLVIGRFFGYFFSPKNIRDVVQQTPMCTCHPEQLAVLIFLRDRSSGYVHGNVLTHAYQRTTQSSSTPTCHVSLRCSILFPPKVQLFSSTR